MAPAVDEPGFLLTGLDPAQQHAVVSTARPLAVLAPAGSGKTRVLTRRVAHRLATGTADPRHVTCVTFTRKAADELGERLRALGVRDSVSTGTFHSLAWAQVREVAQLSRRHPPRLADTPRPLLVQEYPDARPATINQWISEIGWAKARMIGPDGYPAAAAEAGRRPRGGRERVADVYASYEKLKARSGVVDFDDLLARAIYAIRTDKRVRDAIRWRIRHLFVDEFQDVNPLQFALLEEWRGAGWDVFVVGDPHQSVYGWNGAEPGLLTDLADRWPPLEVVRLTSTHRNTPQIAAAAGSVLAVAGLGDRWPEATRPAGPAPLVRSHPDTEAEAAAVAEAIRRAHSGAERWSSFAVLGRTQALARSVMDGLARYGIPAASLATTSGVSTPTTRRLLALLARSDDPAPAGLAAILRSERLDPDDPALDSLAGALERFSEENPDATGRMFAGWARTSLDVSAPPVDAVAVGTFHAAKGLEWPTVHLIGVEEGFVPLASARTRRERDEEARLLYVAITRAERDLQIHWSQTRMTRGRMRERSPSRFLAELKKAVGTVDRAEPRGEGREAISRIRQQFETTGGASSDVDPRRADDDLRRAIVTWRSHKAVVARTEPTTVLADTTLAALVERRPTSEAELAALPGLGPARAARMSAELLGLVAAHRPTFFQVEESVEVDRDEQSLGLGTEPVAGVEGP